MSSASQRRQATKVASRSHASKLDRKWYPLTCNDIQLAETFETKIAADKICIRVTDKQTKAVAIRLNDHYGDRRHTVQIQKLDGTIVGYLLDRKQK